MSSRRHAGLTNGAGVGVDAQRAYEAYVTFFRGSVVAGIQSGEFLGGERSRLGRLHLRDSWYSGARRAADISHGHGRARRGGCRSRVEGFSDRERDWRPWRGISRSVSKPAWTVSREDREMKRADLEFAGRGPRLPELTGPAAPHSDSAAYGDRRSPAEERRGAAA